VVSLVTHIFSILKSKPINYLINLIKGGFVMASKRIISRLLLFTTSILLIVGVLTQANARAEEPIIIAAPLPVTGAYASDGEQMQKGLELAVEEYNQRGGILGRKLKLIVGDVGEYQPETIKAVGERLMGAKPDLVITGYDDGGVDTRVFGEYDVPYLQANGQTTAVAPIVENPEKYSNCFMYIWPDKLWGIDAAENLFFSIPKELEWTPPNKKVAIISVDFSYCTYGADSFKNRVEALGYEVVLYEITPFGVVEWGPILSKIESKKPSFVTFWNIDPMDSARFMMQFSEKFVNRGINALLYMQWVPSVPEFMELTGQASNGVIYNFASPTGLKWKEYRQRWLAKYKKEPTTYSWYLRDGFDIWAQAVKRAGCINCYREINRNILEFPFEGMGGIYVFNPSDHSVLKGEGLFPMTWFQAWNGKGILTAPKSRKKGNYKRPPWMK
jgi:branched-chain amino acid transport system substrate-binding protein